MAALPLLGFWLYGLFDLDEGYYAAVVAEMNRRGEWITPFYNGHPWFEKPILIYWLAKPSVSLFGEWVGPRLPSVLATVGLLLLCGFYLRKRVSGAAGRWSVAILGASLLVIAMGRMMTPDAVLDLCICGAFLSFYESLVGARAWRVVTALCLGLAVLDKGPFSLPIFLALAVWTYVSEPQLRPAFKGYWLLGTIVLSATLATWYWPAYRENGSVFVQKFFVEQNLQRFGGGDEAHKVPFYLAPFYYPLVLLVGMAPWSFMMIWQIRMGAVKGKNGEALERYLVRWAVVVFVLFTVSGTKLPHYILPAVPALAMLAGLLWGRRRDVPWKLFGGLSVGFCLLANFGFLFWYQKGGFAEVHRDARVVNQMVGEGTGLVYAYQLAKVKDAPGLLGINETASPSLAFYLNEPRVELVDLSSFRDSLGADGTKQPGLLSSLSSMPTGACFILTRPGRLTPRQLDRVREIGLSLTAITSPQRNYVLYRVVKATP